MVPLPDENFLLPYDNICTLVADGHSNIYGGVGFLKNFNIDVSSLGSHTINI